MNVSISRSACHNVSSPADVVVTRRYRRYSALWLEDRITSSSRNEELLRYAQTLRKYSRVSTALT